MTEDIKVLKFSASWCKPCRHLSQILDNVKYITSIDIDSQPEIAQEYKVKSVPLLLFIVNEKEVHRHVGIISKNEYLKLITEIQNSKELWEN
jgi:thioredoxin 1